MTTVSPRPRRPAVPNHPTRLLAKLGIVGVATGAALFGVAVAPASADPGQEAGQSTVANVSVESGITMTGLTASFLMSGTPGSTQTAIGAVTYNVETNNVAGYAVTVTSRSDTMDPADGVLNLDRIPIGNLTVRESGAGVFSGLSTSDPVTVHSQDTRSGNGGDDLSSDFRIRVPVVNTDTYSATLDYVATTL